MFALSAVTAVYFGPVAPMGITILSVLSAFTTVIGICVAIFVAWISKQQMDIAREKLKHDLFDRRYSVYAAFVDLIVYAGGAAADQGDKPIEKWRGDDRREHRVFTKQVPFQ